MDINFKELYSVDREEFIATYGKLTSTKHSVNYPKNFYAVYLSSGHLYFYHDSEHIDKNAPFLTSIATDELFTFYIDTIRTIGNKIY